MNVAAGARRRRARLGATTGHYLPDLVYGANDGVITTFAVVCGAVAYGIGALVAELTGV